MGMSGGIGMVVVARGVATDRQVLVLDGRTGHAYDHRWLCVVPARPFGATQSEAVVRVVVDDRKLQSLEVVNVYVESFAQTVVRAVMSTRRHGRVKAVRAGIVAFNGVVVK
jgi:hypothetical protein